MVFRESERRLLLLSIKDYHRLVGIYWSTHGLETYVFQPWRQSELMAMGVCPERCTHSAGSSTSVNPLSDQSLLAVTWIHLCDVKSFIYNVWISNKSFFFKKSRLLLKKSPNFSFSMKTWSQKGFFTGTDCFYFLRLDNPVVRARRFRVASHGIEPDQRDVFIQEM